MSHLEWSVCLSVCLSVLVTTMGPAKTSVSIEMPFVVLTHVGLRNQEIIDGFSHREAAMLEITWVLPHAAKQPSEWPLTSEFPPHAVDQRPDWPGR